MTGNLFAVSIPPDTAAAMLADDATSSMLEEEKRNKNKTNDIGIQVFTTW